MRYLELATEQLECRRMLAGNVNVAVVNGDLRIDGDNDANNVSVFRSGQEVAVLGLEGTTINGTDSNFSTSDFRDDLMINLRGGGNRVFVGAIDVPDDLSIRTGNGNDRIVLALDKTIGDDVNIRSGGGNDIVLSAGTSAGDDMRISTGSGDDFVRLSGDTAEDLRFNSGSGADVAALISTAISDIRINLGGDNDIALSHDVAANAARLSGGGGDDLWFDCTTDVPPSDMFGYAQARSIDGTEIDDLFDRLDDLADEYGVTSP